MRYAYYEIIGVWRKKYAFPTASYLLFLLRAKKNNDTKGTMHATVAVFSLNYLTNHQRRLHKCFTHVFSAPGAELTDAETIINMSRFSFQLVEPIQKTPLYSSTIVDLIAQHLFGYESGFHKRRTTNN